MARWGWSVLVGIAAGTLVLAGCGTSSPGGAAGGIRVVASTDVWGSVVRVVGGDRVDVTAVIHDPAQDPHDYQATPADAATVSKATLAVYNGDGYDDFFADALHAAPSAQRSTIVAFDLSGHVADRSPNEHVFYDLPTVIRVADAVAGKLGTIDHAHAAEFTANARRFDQSVNALLAKVKRIGADHPGGRVVVTEPVADYLLAAAGVTDATPPAFARAVEGDGDVPVTAINDMLNLITGRRVAALVNNAQTETNVTNRLKAKARSAGVPIVDVTETLPAGVTDYVAWMANQVNALAGALTAGR